MMMMMTMMIRKTNRTTKYVQYRYKSDNAQQTTQWQDNKDKRKRNKQYIYLSKDLVQPQFVQGSY